MNNFTPRAQQVLALARKEADRFNHNYVGTEHILLGLIKLGQGVAVSVLQNMGLDLETVRIEVEKQVGSGPDNTISGNIPYTPRVKKVLSLSNKEAEQLDHSYVGTEHILLGLLREGEGVAARVLTSLNVDINQTRQEILAEIDPNFNPDDLGDEFEDFEDEGEIEAQGEGEGKSKTPALKAFGRDLTKLAKKDKLDPVIGRSSEIERVIQILCRRTKTIQCLLVRLVLARPPLSRDLLRKLPAAMSLNFYVTAVLSRLTSPSWSPEQNTVVNLKNVSKPLWMKFAKTETSSSSSMSFIPS